jgi:hypothetical protein
MNREYHRWFSPRLDRDMELLIFGHAGAPYLVFPSSMGTFHEYEDSGMIGALGENEKATTVDLTVHYLRPVVKGAVTCTAQVLRAGKRLLTVSAEVVNEEGKLIATALSTYSKV